MEINTRHSLNIATVKCVLHFIVITLIVASFNARAVYKSEQTYKSDKLNRNTVQYYKDDNVTNEIPYFDNRFRLDAQLDEITLIFYRKSGSTPIILIRPDGSKVRIDNYDQDMVQWFDDSTFDLIKIKKPMPGPWQAVGNILPNSQILVVSDVKIAVEPLPEIVFSGETLKVEGTLFNGTNEIKSTNFRKVVNLDVNFYSTNNSLYENFGASAEKVTSFRDDGKGLDEYANDNKFTGEFVLHFAPGEWQPVYLVKMPMTTRELRQKPILIHKTPVQISIEVSDDTETPHQASLTIDPALVDPDSLIFQGKFTFPDRQTESFSIMEGSGNSRITSITNTESGLYRINVSAFGKTIKGREFRLVLPEFSFNVEEEELVEDPLQDDGMIETTNKVDEILLQAELDKDNALNEQIAIQEQKGKETLIWIAIGNIVILVVAMALFFLLRNKKNTKTTKKSK